jgi:hypothetical protein
VGGPFDTQHAAERSKIMFSAAFNVPKRRVYEISRKEGRENEKDVSSDVAPRLVYHSCWRYIEVRGKSNYCITGNFVSQTFLSAVGGWRYIGV